jgi:hypothetical protein
MLLVCIQEVPGTNLGRDTTILSEFVRDFPQNLQANAGIVPYTKPWALSSIYIIFRYSLSAIIRYWVPDSAFKLQTTRSEGRYKEEGRRDMKNKE